MTPLRASRLSAASNILVDNRMSHRSGSAGWSRTWVINLYKRLFLGTQLGAVRLFLAEVTDHQTLEH
jgi:hypothetical protein